MASKRSYGDACGIARALDVVGERWALMVVRELLLGPEALHRPPRRPAAREPRRARPAPARSRAGGRRAPSQTATAVRRHRSTS